MLSTAKKRVISGQKRGPMYTFWGVKIYFAKNILRWDDADQKAGIL